MAFTTAPLMGFVLAPSPQAAQKRLLALQGVTIAEIGLPPLLALTEIIAGQRSPTLLGFLAL
jgi:hypothetical protein